MLSICFSIICFIFLLRFLLYRTGFIYVVTKWTDWINDRVHLHQHFNIPELDGSTHQENRFYRRVSLYVSSLSSLQDSDFVDLVSGEKPNDVVLCPGDNQIVYDTFLGGRVSWLNKIKRGVDGDGKIVYRSFVLRIKKEDKRRILKRYVEHVIRVSDDIEKRGRQLRIYNLSDDGRWKSVPFDHPASFESLAMDADLKSKIRSDLGTFVKSERYYRKLGHVWKRSYLLYGPSGARKSSFIAAVANFLNYDVYKIDLSRVVDDADLNSLLLRSACGSLIVVEDVDRWFGSRSTNVTPSGLMNFMDGVSNFRGGRIMIFTASVTESLDPDLLRPGRIDVRVNFPNYDYLGVKEHKLFPVVEEVFHGGAAMSAAEINRGALKSGISALQPSGRKGRKVVPLENDSPAPAASPLCAAEDDGGGHWKEASPKEIRKLCGLLRMKSGKKAAPLDRDSEIIER